MTTLPSAASFTDASVTEGDFKNAMTDLVGYLTGLFGTGGDSTSALNTVRAFCSRISYISSAYTVLATDKGKLIAAYGTFTVTLPSITTVGPLFTIVINNCGSGAVTVSTTSGQALLGFGASTYQLKQNESLILISDGGTTWYTVPVGVSKGLLRITSITSSGTWVKGSDVGHVRVLVVGGGGGGGAGYSGGMGAGGGGGGGSAIAEINGTSLASTISVTVGAGGAGGASQSANGANGGTSAFGGWVSATGGSGGQGRASSGAYAAGGSAGSPSAYPAASNLPIQAFGSTDGGAASGTTGAGNYGQAGGNSAMGAGGAAITISGTGNSAAANSGGGGGGGKGWAGGTGGAGGSGIVIVWEYA